MYFAGGITPDVLSTTTSGYDIIVKVNGVEKQITHTVKIILNLIHLILTNMIL